MPFHMETAPMTTTVPTPRVLTSGDFKVADLEPPKGQTEFRVEARRKLLTEIDEVQRQVAAKEEAKKAKQAAGRR